MKGFIAPSAIGLLIFVSGLLLIAGIVVLRYSVFDANIKRGFEESMDYVDIAHAVKQCMIEGDKMGLTDAGKIDACTSDWEDFEITLEDVDDKEPQLYVTTKDNEVKGLYVSKKEA